MAGKKKNQPKASGASDKKAAGGGSREWHIGSRINVLDMVRFSEQASILLSELTGLEPTKLTHRQFKHWILPWFLGSLRHSFCNPLILHRDSGETAASEIWQPFGRIQYKRQFNPLLKKAREFDLDLVCSSLDGAGSLCAGRTSSACIIAGGERGCFIGDPEPGAQAVFRSENSDAPFPAALPDKFFVIVVGPDVATPANPSIFGGKVTNSDEKDAPAPTAADAGTPPETAAGPDAAPPAGPAIPGGAGAKLNEKYALVPTPSAMLADELLDEFLERERPLQNLVAMIQQRGGRPTIGVCREGFEHWSCPTTVRVRRAVMEGSTVGAAMAALLRTRGVDFACMFCRRTHAILVAAATKALGGSAWFIPIVGGDRIPPRIATEPSPRLYREEELVPGKHVFVIATGVTAGRALLGVECRDHNHVVTHSLCLSSFHRAKRRITNRFDLERACFVNPEGHTLASYDAITRFRKEVEKDLARAAASLKDPPPPHVVTKPKAIAAVTPTPLMDAPVTGEQPSPMGNSASPKSVEKPTSR